MSKTTIPKALRDKIVRRAGNRCEYCNSYKGVSVVNYDYKTKEITLLFNPRRSDWGDHFRLQKTGVIASTSSTGWATIQVLKLNDRIRIEARERLIANGLLQTAE